jgi:hypothetical protein
MPAVAPFCIVFPISLSTLNRKKVNMPSILLRITLNQIQFCRLFPLLVIPAEAGIQSMITFFELK